MSKQLLLPATLLIVGSVLLAALVLSKNERPLLGSSNNALHSSMPGHRFLRIESSFMDPKSVFMKQVHQQMQRAPTCPKLGLPQPPNFIPLSANAYEMDNGAITNDDVNIVHEANFYIALPKDMWNYRIDQQTGEFETLNNANMHGRVKEVKPSDGIFIDVGGHIGDTALPSAAMGIDTYVFEPVRKNTNMIHTSILANDCLVSEHLTIVNALVGDKNSAHESVYVTARSDNAARTKEAATMAMGDNDGDFEQPVAMITLDSFFPSGTRVANFKIDVQGFELGVLRGSERLLRENKGNLLLRFECNINLLSAAGTAPNHIFNYLSELGYEEVERDGPDRIWK